MKRYLEMRGADGVPWGRLPALPAFWVGLLYDNTSLDAAWDIVKHWNAQERQAHARRRVAHGLQDPDQGPLFVRNRHGMPDAGAFGLAAARPGDHLGRDESRHLEPLERIRSGRCPAEEMLEKFHGPWHGSVEPAYEEYAF